MSPTKIYGINLAVGVTVCLHCGEPGAPGALFCTKCGYTLPQVEASPPPAGSAVAPGPSATPGVPAVSPARAAPPMYVPVTPPGAYAAPIAVVPGAVGPIPPPPNGKYCIRCGTLISRPAVYCPVCQQPQP